ncbi:MAG: hypothetical protein KIT54_05290 [Phycisphaeraceae bacterium]|nr:hypothetical protein [Phycisphaeraceae bacterium]
MRQAATFAVALVLFAAAAVVFFQKFSPATHGPVRLDIANGTPGSLLELELNLVVPKGEAVGTLPSSVAIGGVVTAYEGLGPVTIVSVSYVGGADGSAFTHRIDRVLEPGGIMTLRISPDGVVVDAGAGALQIPGSR